jgi:hypothetical protein
MNLASFVVSLVRPVTRETVLEDARVYAQSRLQNRPGIIGRSRRTSSPTSLARLSTRRLAVPVTSRIVSSPCSPSGTAQHDGQTSDRT